MIVLKIIGALLVTLFCVAWAMATISQTEGGPIGVILPVVVFCLGIWWIALIIKKHRYKRAREAARRDRLSRQYNPDP